MGRGYQQGFIRQIVKIGSWVVAFVAAFMLDEELGLFISDMVSIPALEQPFFSVDLEKVTLNAAAFFILLFSVRWFTGWLGSFLGLAGHLPVISQFNRFSGAFIALVKSLLFFMLAVNLLSFVPGIEVYLSSSWFAGRLMALSSWLLDAGGLALLR